MISFPIECKCNQASKSLVPLPCNSAIAAEQFILCPLWTGMDILLGLFFLWTDKIISTASRAATFLRRKLSQVSEGRFTMFLRSSDLEGMEPFQKCSMKILQILPYSARTFLSSCRLWEVTNLREHLEERMNFIKIKTEAELEDSYRNSILQGILFLTLGYFHF